MPRILIAGCGFVGLATARLFHQHGWEVVGCTHSLESAASLASEPFKVRPVDISEARAVDDFAGPGVFQAVIHCASSGKGGADQYRRVYLEGARNLSDALRPGILIFTSSTSVYAQVSGEEVDETSEAIPDRETGQVLRETEDLVVKRGGAVARLAGIYGPGRSVLLRKFFSREAVIEDQGQRWINQIHRDDAATALFAMVNGGARGLFNVSDDRPTSQREVYEWLAAKFQQELPPTGPIPTNRKRGWTHKRVLNARLRSLGWAPKFPSFFDAVESDPELVSLAREQVSGGGETE